MRRLLADIRLTAALLLVAMLLALNLLAMRGTVQAATDPEVVPCVAIASAESEQLYFCDTDYIDCVWDPSPAMRSGLVDCEW